MAGLLDCAIAVVKEMTRRRSRTAPVERELEGGLIEVLRVRRRRC